ncbi:hypothetical protein [Methylobacterium sp. CM6257]|jgi:hypothetical protein
MTTLVPTDLELAIRHVTEGTERVINQARLVARLKAEGHDTAEAEGLLAEFRHALALMEDRRQRLQAEHEADE